MKLGFDYYESPIGTLFVVCDDTGVRRIEMFEKDWEAHQEKNGEIQRNVLLCQEAITQLNEYFIGERREFTVAISLNGTDFRKKVWQALSHIPYGETRSYQDIAVAIGNPKAVRAIGQANRANQIPIIIPCHRVIGKSGGLVGYAGNNTHLQKHLLQLEGICARG